MLTICKNEQYHGITVNVEERGYKSIYLPREILELIDSYLPKNYITRLKIYHEAKKYLYNFMKSRDMEICFNRENKIMSSYKNIIANFEMIHILDLRFNNKFLIDSIINSNGYDIHYILIHDDLKIKNRRLLKMLQYEKENIDPCDGCSHIMNYCELIYRKIIDPKTQATKYFHLCHNCIHVDKLHWIVRDIDTNTYYTNIRYLSDFYPDTFIHTEDGGLYPTLRKYVEMLINMYCIGNWEEIKYMDIFPIK